MAMREYIGARYVPRFMGTYDPTAAYEALDVVDNGTGTSYIARKIVPPGTSLTNTEYWFVYGASSGAIIQLQNDMIQAQNDIGALQGDVLNINSDISDIETKLGVNRRVITISDSYGLVRGGQTPWTTAIQSLLNISASDYFTYSEGSMGFNRAGDGGHKVEALLTLHSTDITDHDTITDVIFALGLNDMYGLTGLAAAIDSCMNYTKTEYPNAKIWIAYIGNRNAKSTAIYNDYMTSLKEYVAGAGRNNAAYMTNSEYVMHDSRYLQSDGIHPTTEGAEAIAEFIVAYINGGANVLKSSRCDVTTQFFGTSYFNQTMANGSCENRPNFANTSRSFSLLKASFAEIATITDPIMEGQPGTPHYGLGYIYDGTVFQPFIWSLYGGKVYAEAAVADISVPTGARIQFMDINAPTIAM